MSIFGPERKKKISGSTLPIFVAFSHSKCIRWKSIWSIHNLCNDKSRQIV